MLPSWLKESGLPAFAALPVLLWLAFSGAVLQALVLPLLLGGLRREYYLASRAIFTLLHRPLLYLFQYSGSRVYLHALDLEQVLGNIGSDQAAILVNHRGDLDWLVGLQVLDGGGGVGCCKAIIKRSLLAVPFFGFIWWAVDFVCIRRNWKADSITLAAGFKNQHEYQSCGVPYALTIFPEGTRLTPKKLLESQEFAKSRDLPVFQHCLCPRTKGVWSALNSLRLDAVYDATVIVSGASSGSKANLLSLAKGEPVDIHVYMDRVLPDDVPKSEESLQKWLFKRWEMKESHLDRFQKKPDGPFGPEKAKRHELLVRPSAGLYWVGALLWWLLCTAFFVRTCLAYEYYKLLSGAVAGFVLLIAACMVVLHLVHFKKDKPHAKKG